MQKAQLYDPEHHANGGSSSEHRESQAHSRSSGRQEQAAHAIQPKEARRALRSTLDRARGWCTGRSHLSRGARPSSLKLSLLPLRFSVVDPVSASRGDPPDSLSGERAAWDRRAAGLARRGSATGAPARVIDGAHDDVETGSVNGEAASTTRHRRWRSSKAQVPGLSYERIFVHTR